MKPRFLLLTALLALVTYSASAYDFTEDNLAYDINEDGTSVTLTYMYSAYPAYPEAFFNGSLIIPSSVTHEGVTYTVNTVGYCAFQGVTSITSITIPSTITTIEDNAFVYCSGLTSLVVESGNSTYDSRGDCNAIIETGSNTLIYGCVNTVVPNTVTKIGSYAFYKYKNLKSITLPVSVTYIDNNAFYECSGLESVDIQGPLTYIGMTAFSWCTKLQSIVLPSTITKLDYQAFAGCTGLTRIDSYADPSKVKMGTEVFSYVPMDGTLHVPEMYLSAYQEAAQWKKFTNIAGDLLLSYDFMEGGLAYKILEDGTSVAVTCENNTSPRYYSLSGNVSIPSTVTHEGTTYTVTEIGSYAFYECENITSITIPNSVKIIRYYAFYKCSGLTTLRIPNSVTSIDVGVFRNCVGLTSVTIPASVVSIGNQAFQRCTALTSVTIPASVINLGNQAFAACSGLTRIDSYPDPAAVTLGLGVFQSVPKDGTLHVLPQYLSAYQTANQWSSFTNIAGDLKDATLGDVNGDGGVDVTDVVALAQYVMGEAPESFNRDAADLTDDDAVDITDVVALANVVMGS